MTDGLIMEIASTDGGWQARGMGSMNSQTIPNGWYARLLLRWDLHKKSSQRIPSRKFVKPLLLHKNVCAGSCIHKTL